MLSESLKIISCTFTFFIYVSLNFVSISARAESSWGHSMRIFPPKIAVAETSVDFTRIRIINTTPRKLFDTLATKYQSYNIPVILKMLNFLIDVGQVS